MTYTGTISTNKTNRLYWLGRYAERAYLNLHLLRKYYDKTIDGEEIEYKEYFEKLHISIDSNSTKDTFLNQMYDTQNPTSVISDIERANDNAIVLREELMSETLSYIQLSRCLLERCAKDQIYNITELQPITDYLLAFWGSVEERIANIHIINILHTGRLAEGIDMRVRFDYPYEKIRPKVELLLQCADNNPTLFDIEVVKQLDSLVCEKLYDLSNPSYKDLLLQSLNNAILI